MKTTRIRNSISLAADVAGILAFIGLTATGVVAWLEKSHSHSWNIVAYMFLAFVIMPVIGYIALKQLASYREERKLHLPELKEFMLSSSQLRSRLASDGMLASINQKLMKHIHDWDPDVVVSNIRMNNTIEDRSYTISFGVDVYSSWRKKRGYIGILVNSTGKSKFIEYLTEIGIANPKEPLSTAPFFEIYPNWRDEVIRLYGPIEFSPKRSIHVVVEQEKDNQPLKISIEDDTEGLNKQNEELGDSTGENI